MTKLTAMADVAKIAESVMAIVAFIAGAVWFHSQRETYPRSDIQQSVTVARIQPEVIAVEVHVNLENTGKKLIQLTGATVNLQSVESDPYDITKLADITGADYWSAVRPPVTTERQHFSEGELRWPVLNQYKGPLNHDIEPGETDLSVFTFVLRCDDPFSDKPRTLRQLRVATNMYKPEDSDEPDFSWKARSFVDVSDACNRGKK